MRITTDTVAVTVQETRPRTAAQTELAQPERTVTERRFENPFENPTGTVTETLFPTTPVLVPGTPVTSDEGLFKVDLETDDKELRRRRGALEKLFETPVAPPQTVIEGDLLN